MALSIAEGFASSDRRPSDTYCESKRIKPCGHILDTGEPAFGEGQASGLAP